MKRVIAYLGFSLILVSVIFSSGCISKTEVENFDECMAMGYPVMESYPRQCKTPDGTIFVEEVSPIGGQRDEHGCLGPAGYTWNETVGACIREWELNENQKQAAKTAVDYLGYKYATTITEVLTARCPGCFVVRMEQGENRDATSVTIDNWIAVSKTVTRHTCTEEEKQAEICTMEYDPVCGYKNEESKTYGNGCSACTEGVDYWENGECEEEKIIE